MTTTAANSGQWIAKGVHQETWSAMGSTAVGAALSAPHLPHKVGNVQGVFGGATIVIEGSQDGGTVYSTLKDPNGTALSFTAAAEFRIDNPAPLIRPNSSGGDTTTAIITRITSQKF